MRLLVLVLLCSGGAWGFEIVQRAGWSARPPRSTTPLRRPLGLVVVHHSYLPAACHSQFACSAAMRNMQAFHMDSHGWDDIGYNFAVGSDGRVYEGRGWSAQGAHASGINDKSIGICLIGDWRYVAPPANQLSSARGLIDLGVKRGFLRPNYALIGHRQSRGDTECPGDALFREIQRWKGFTKSIPSSYKPSPASLELSILKEHQPPTTAPTATATATATATTNTMRDPPQHLFFALL